MSIYPGWCLHHWPRRRISKDLFALSPEYQSNVRTSMKTWVIIIRFGNHGFEDHDHDPDDCNQEEVQIPPCPPSPRGESSPACSCRAWNKNQSGVIKTWPNFLFYILIFVFPSMPVQFFVRPMLHQHSQQLTILSWLLKLPGDGVKPRGGGGG